MHLTPREQERLMLHSAGILAKQRKPKELKLNYPETVAYITAGLLELARENYSVTELMSKGRELLTADGYEDNEFEGSGVGLALVDRIMRRHGGKVETYGEVDRGAEFCLFFLKL